MGQEQSQAGGGQNPSALSDKEAMRQLEKIEGLQVVRLLPNSVAHRAGLVPYFDILVGVDGKSFVDIISTSEVIDRLESKGGSGSLEFRYFRDFLATHQGQRVCFDVFNLHIRHMRQVVLTLADSPSGGGLLGCSIEWSRAVDVIGRCWHVVDVLPKSPASQCADIHPGADYILGMQQPMEQIITLLHDERDFYQRMELWQTLQRTALFQAQRASRALQTQAPTDGAASSTSSSAQPAVPHNILILVYNAQENAVKEVLIEMGTRPGTPLGLSLATGAIHWIPAVHTTDLGQLPVMNHFCLTNTSYFETSYHEASAATTTAAPRKTEGPATAPPQPTAGGSSSNPFRRDDVGAEMPAYPPPPPLPTAPTPSVAPMDPHGRTAAPPTVSSSALTHSPPSLAATAEPSFGGPESLSASFPRAGGEVFLPHWAAPAHTASAGEHAATPLSLASQAPSPGLVPPPPPPPPPAPDAAHAAHAAHMAGAAHAYPDPSQLGVSVAAHARPAPPPAELPPVVEAPRPTPPPPPSPPVVAAVDTQPVQEKLAAAASSTSAPRHPPLPPHVQASAPSSAVNGVPAKMASAAAGTTSPAVLAPPRPPAYIARASLEAVPRPPVNFDLFGDGASHS